jgi:hypothetical protein
MNAEQILKEVQASLEPRRLLFTEAEIQDAYVNGIATRILELGEALQGLHKELLNFVPDEINQRPADRARISSLVQRALELVPATEGIHTPANKLPGFKPIPFKWTPHPGPHVVTGFRDEHPMTVPGPLPRNVDGIPTNY